MDWILKFSNKIEEIELNESTTLFISVPSEDPDLGSGFKVKPPKSTQGPKEYPVIPGVVTKLPDGIETPDPTFQVPRLPEATITQAKPNFFAEFKSQIDNAPLWNYQAHLYFKPAYQTLDGFYSAYNWIAHRQTYNLAGENIGRMAAEKNAVLTVGTSMFGAIAAEASALKNVSSLYRVMDDAELAIFKNNRFKFTPNPNGNSLYLWENTEGVNWWMSNGNWSGNHIVIMKVDAKYVKLNTLSRFEEFGHPATVVDPLDIPNFNDMIKSVKIKTNAKKAK